MSSEPRNDEQASYRRILSSTSIIGSATILSILIGVVRTKVLALMVGPTGIGMIGVLTNISGLAVSLSSLGLGNAAVRDIAAVRDLDRQAAVRRAVWLASLPLGLLGGLLLWLFRNPIALIATGDRQLAFSVGLSGVAVTFGVIALVQQGVLQALQRVKALGAIRIGSALLATMMALPAVYWWGESGTIAAVIAVPLAAVLVALPFAPRELLRPGSQRRAALAAQWYSLLKLGIVMTLAGAIGLLSLAGVRAVIVRESGLEAAGLFQAVVTLSTMNITLVLGSMAADYFPRLSATAGTPPEVSRIVNQQLQSALLLAMPLILALIAAAPLVMRLLYSSEFTEAATLLRWQLVGDFLKLPGWALGFALLARGNRRTYLLIEGSHGLTYVLTTIFLVRAVGPEGAGIAYSAAYAIYATLLVVVCRRQQGISLESENLRLLATAVLPALGLLLLAKRSELLALGAGATLSVGAALLAYRTLSRRAGFSLREGS